MKKINIILSVILSLIVLSSAVVIPSVVFVNASEESVTLTPAEFTLKRINNCTIEDNKIISANNTYPQFSIIFDEPYRIETIRITATVCEGFTYINGGACMSLKTVDSETAGSFKSNFAGGQQTTRSLTLDFKYQSKEISTVSCIGYWNKKPGAGEAWMTIDSIEIDISDYIDAPEITVSDVTENSFKASWTAEEGINYSLWYSEEQITSDNFDTVEKTKAAEGEISEATLTGLKNRTPYYLALKSQKGSKKGYAFAVCVPQAEDDTLIVLTTNDYKLERVANCSISGNKILSTTNRYPQFKISLNSKYYVEEVKITATVSSGYNYVSTSGNAAISLVTANAESAGKLAGTFPGGATTTLSFKPGAEFAESEINLIGCNGYWNKVPSANGAAFIQINKIEIVGTKSIDPPEIEFGDIAPTSMTASWEQPKGATFELYMSESEITAENFDTADKTLVDSGNINTVSLSDLITNKVYYFALKMVYGVQTKFSYGSAKPYIIKTVYDFEKSTVFSDYTVKTRNDSKSFYFRNGNYGVTAAISEPNEYSDSGNSLKFTFGEWDATRYPILMIYAPNWADYSGEGIEMTLAKTKNTDGEDITVPCRLEAVIPNVGTFQYKKGSQGILWPKSTDKQTLTFDYSDFTLSTDSSVVLTPELSQDITRIQFFFNVPMSVGYFDLYVDSIMVLKAIPIVRQVENITFASDVITMQEGGTVTQEPVYEPYNATENDFVFTSDSPDIASVVAESGLVTANKQGIAKITATAPNGVSKTYKVIVKEDMRGMQYRDLFTFDDGVIPSNMAISGCSPALDYLKSDAEVSLKLIADGKMSATFTVDDYAFYGEGIGIWTCGDGGGKYVTLDLITKSGKTYTYSLMTDVEDGNYVTLDYTLFTQSGTGAKLTKQDIIDLKQLRVSYDKSLYIDSIKVKDPQVYNLKRKPENTNTAKDVNIIDSKNSLGGYKYYFSALSNGGDYDWAKETLIEAGIIASDTIPDIFSIYFVDGDFVQHDLSNPLNVQMKIPFALSGMNNIWVLRMDENEINGVTAHISGDMITFEATKSGIYCMVEGDGDLYLTKKIKSKDVIEIMVSGGTEPQTTTRTVETIRRKRVADNSGIPMWLLWVIIPAAVLVIAGGTVATILIIKKRKAGKVVETV